VPAFCRFLSVDAVTMLLHPAATEGQAMSLTTALDPLRAGIREGLRFLRSPDLTRHRRTGVATSAQFTAGALICTVVLLAQGNLAAALPFAGLTLVIATATASLHVVSLKLMRTAHLLTYGVAAIGSTCAFLTVTLAARTTDDAITAIGLVPPLAGSWLAVRWVSDLTNHGLTGAVLADATTTIRGTAAIWIAFIVIVALEVPLSVTGHDLPIAAALGDGLAGIFSLAAIFTYVGPGWTEYQRGRAIARTPVCGEPGTASSASA
jgi:hypothetical protein